MEGTSGPGTDLGSAVQAAAPQTLTATPSDSSGYLVGIQIAQVMGAFHALSDTSQHLPTGSEMGSQVQFAMHHPLSEHAEVRVLRAARCAIRQFHRKNLILHKGQVITSEAQLAVIFGQRVVDKVRASLSLPTHSRRSTDARKQQQPKLFCTARAGPLWPALSSTLQVARPGLFLLYCFHGLIWKLPARIGYFTFNVNALFRLGRLRLVLQYLNHYSLHAAGLQGTRPSGDRAKFTSPLDFFDASSPRYHVLHWGYGSKSLEQVDKCTTVSLTWDARVYPVDRIVQWLTPPCRLQERLGGVVIRRRSADAQEDFQKS